MHAIRRRWRRIYTAYVPVNLRLHIDRWMTRDPHTFNEKIRYQMARETRALVTELTDKITAQRYVRERIGADYLLPNLGIWQPGEHIDWSKLPREVAVKVNHASGGLIIRTNLADPSNRPVLRRNGWARVAVHPEIFDPDWANRQIQLWLSRSYGRGYYLEPQYWSIPPAALAQPLLCEIVGGEREFARTIRVYTLHGQPIEMVVEHSDIRLGTDSDDAKRMIIDQWDGSSPLYDFPAEQLLDCLRLTELLAEGFEQVRVDWLWADGQLYFSEFTFTSAAGRIGYTGHPLGSVREYDTLLGSYWHME